MFTKNQQVLALIIKKYGKPSVTSLMKLCYLTDLVSIQKKQPQVTEYTYKRYNYGPFDDKIYSDLEKLIANDAIKPEIEYTPRGDEFVTYQNLDKNFEFDKITEDEKKHIDEVLESLKGYGAKVLTEIAYQTKPMKAIKATIGGNEGLNEILNLNAN